MDLASRTLAAIGVPGGGACSAGFIFTASSQIGSAVVLVAGNSLGFGVLCFPCVCTLYMTITLPFTTGRKCDRWPATHSRECLRLWLQCDPEPSWVGTVVWVRAAPRPRPLLRRRSQSRARSRRAPVCGTPPLSWAGTAGAGVNLDWAARSILVIDTCVVSPWI